MNADFYDKKILVVDDDVNILKLIIDFLLRYGLKVYSAPNGIEALKLIEGKKPDLIISDLMMPVMDGYELCEKIKSHELLSHIPFAMLTAKDTSSDMIFGAKKGADYHIIKPFDPELLLVDDSLLLDALLFALLFLTIPISLTRADAEDFDAF